MYVYVFVSPLSVRVVDVEDHLARVWLTMGELLAAAQIGSKWMDVLATSSLSLFLSSGSTRSCCISIWSSLVGFPLEIGGQYPGQGGSRFVNDKVPFRGSFLVRVRRPTLTRRRQSRQSVGPRCVNVGFLVSDRDKDHAAVVYRLYKSSEEGQGQGQDGF